MKYLINRVCVLAGSVLLLAGCGNGAGFRLGANDADWPLFRGNAALNGYTDVRLPQAPVLMWTHKSDARTSSSPVVAGGSVYWCDRRGVIRGLDAAGAQLFDYDLKTAVEASPMIRDTMMYIGQVDGFVSAISLIQRDTLWTFETMGQIAASPNAVEFGGKQAVIVGSYDNYLYCIDSGTGAALNRFVSGYYLNGAVAIMDHYALFGGCDSWLRIIDCERGMATDSLELEDYIPASPAIMEGDCYVGDYSGNIYECRVQNGKFVSHRKILEATDGGDAFVSVPAVSPSALYVLAGNQSLYSIDRSSGETNWQYLLKGESGESSPIVCHDRVLVCTRTGVVSIIDAKNGTLLWEYDTGEQIIASPAVVSGRFFILTEKGTLFCFGN